MKLKIKLASSIVRAGEFLFVIHGTVVIGKV